MIHPLLNTALKDRVLYYDGDSVVTPDHLLSLINLGLSSEGLYVTEVTGEIEQFNALVPPKKRITKKTETRPLNFDWNLPEPYNSWTDQDIVDYIIDAWSHECCIVYPEMSSEDCDIRCKRVNDEITLYKKLDLLPVLRTIIFVINTLQENKVVWGVGRGSSVSSYVLYLIGAHDVDSIKYGLDINEFLRESPSNTPEQEI